MPEKRTLLIEFHQFKSRRLFKKMKKRQREKTDWRKILSSSDKTATEERQYQLDKGEYIKLASFKGNKMYPETLNL